MIITNLLPIIIVFIFCIVFFSKHYYLASHFALFDLPDYKRKIHLEKIPITGGIGFLILLLLIYFLNISDLFQFERILLEKLRNLFAFYFIAIFYFLVGLYDDKFLLNPIPKLLNLIIASIFLLNVSPDLIIRNITLTNFDKVIELEHLSFFFTIFCLIVFTQALNMFDGMNGQSTIFSIAIFFYFYNVTNDIFFVILIIYLLFFLYFNLKNKSFLGDSGIYLISFVISFNFLDLYNYNLIKCDQILLLLLYPGLDLIRLFIKRLVNGCSPFLADRNHIHHYLLKKIGYKKTIVYFLIIFILTNIFAIFNIIEIGILFFSLIYFITIRYSKC